MFEGTRSDILARAKTPALLVTNLINIRYLTGVEVSAGAVLLTGRRTVFFVDGRYSEIAEKNSQSGITVRSIDALKQAMKSVKQCGFEAEDVTVARLKRLKKNFSHIRFKPTAGVLEHFRRSKSATELRYFIKAQQIASELMKRVPKALKPGVTEQAIAKKLHDWAIELGAGSLSFDPIVAFGPHSARPHHHPTSRKLKGNDIVQIDVGAKYNGYCSDKSRVFFVGKPTARQQQVLDAVTEAKAVAEALIAPGITNHQLDKAARNALKKHKLEQYFVHGLGHGVGLEIHEGSSLSQRAPKAPLLKNEVVTIEPGVYIPGKFGIRLEDEVVVQ